MKYLKPCLSKGNSLDTTILLIPISVIEIRLLYWWNSNFSISLSTNVIIFWSVFINGYNFLWYFFILIGFLKWKHPYILAHYFLKNMFLVTIIRHFCSFFFFSQQASFFMFWVIFVTFTMILLLIFFFFFKKILMSSRDLFCSFFLIIFSW